MTVPNKPLNRLFIFSIDSISPNQIPCLSAIGTRGSWNFVAVNSS